MPDCDQFATTISSLKTSLKQFIEKELVKTVKKEQDLSSTLDEIDDSFEVSINVNYEAIRTGGAPKASIWKEVRPLGNTGGNREIIGFRSKVSFYGD